jgi:IS1 family transposase
MNRLPLEKRAQILHLLVEGSSMRATSRVTGASFNTIMKLLLEAGEACQAFHDARVRNVKSRRIECDEIWQFNYCKKANLAKAKAAPDHAGDVWTWTALDADSKLIVTWLVGDRDAEAASEFIQDVADRLVNRVQLTTDGHKPYLGAVEDAFGADIDYAMLVKIYGESGAKGPERKYSPGECCGAVKRKIEGNPDRRLVSTSYVEKHNQTMRQHMRRFTRLTNAHSKKFANHCAAQAMYFVYYNFVRINSAVKTSPAMAAGVETKLWEMTDLLAMVDAYWTAKKAESSN